MNKIDFRTIFTETMLSSCEDVTKSLMNYFFLQLIVRFIL